MSRSLYVSVLLAAGFVAGACSNENEANRRGIGSECAMSSDCTESGQVCLTEFKGGYCGLSACRHDTDCPQGSACVTDDNQVNYCFLVCTDKTQCNLHRTADNESSCTSSLTFIDGTMGRKVCRPPLSGTTTGDGGTD